MRTTETLNRIVPLHPSTLIPPEGSVPFGTTPDGKQLWHRITRRSRAVPDIDPRTGEQRWRTNLMGERILPLFKPEFYNKEETFWLHSQGNGNVEHIPYYPPTPEEIARGKREEQIAGMTASLAGALVDAGLTPDKLVEMIRTMKAGAPEKPVEPAAAQVEPAAEQPADESVKYPVHLGARWWTLSNGQKFGGSRAEAEAAEKKVPAEEREMYAKAKRDADAAVSY